MILYFVPAPLWGLAIVYRSNRTLALPARGEVFIAHTEMQRSLHMCRGSIVLWLCIGVMATTIPAAAQGLPTGDSPTSGFRRSLDEMYQHRFSTDRGLFSDGGTLPSLTLGAGSAKDDYRIY